MLQGGSLFVKRRILTPLFLLVLGLGCSRAFADSAPTTLVMPDVLGPIGQRVVITGVLTRTDTGAYVPGKTVVFLFGSVSMGSAVTDGAGRARVYFLVTEPMGIAKYPISCQFAGDANCQPSSAAAQLITVRAGTSLAFKGQSATLGRPVALKATLSRITDGTLLTGRTVQFLVKNTKVGAAVTDSTGTATLTYTFDEPLGLGPQTVVASFLGDTLEQPTDTSAVFTVTQSKTKITVTGATGSAGKTVTIKAKLVRASDGAVLNGRTLSFTVAGKAAGTATMTLGAAYLAYTIPAGFAPGTYPIKVDFAGEADYLPSTGTGTLTVK